MLLYDTKGGIVALPELLFQYEVTSTSGGFVEVTSYWKFPTQNVCAISTFAHNRVQINKANLFILF